MGARRRSLRIPSAARSAMRASSSGAFVLGRKLCAGYGPASRGRAAAQCDCRGADVFGFAAFGRVPAMLNFTAGLENLRSACATAQIRTVVTSRRFVEQGKLDESSSDFRTPRSEGRCASSISRSRTGLDSRSTSARAGDGLARGAGAPRHAPRPDDPAVILFTSGSEGRPKGVVLSSANLVEMSGRPRHISVAAARAGRVVLNPLPVFHSYGLTGGLCCRRCSTA